MRVDVQDIRNDEVSLAHDENGVVLSFRNIPDTPFYLWDEDATRMRQEETELYDRIASRSEIEEVSHIVAERYAKDDTAPIVLKFKEGDLARHRELGLNKIDSVFDNGFVYLQRQPDGYDPYIYQNDLEAEFMQAEGTC